MDPSETVAVVSGGTGGLGSAVVRKFVARGYRLGVTYLIPEEGTALENELGLSEEHMLLRRVDATDPEAVNDFFKAVSDQFGGIHIVCSLVGGWAGGRDVEETDDVRFERMIDLNLRSAFYAVRAGLPYLRESGWGRVIAVGSRAAYDTPAGQSAYNLSKAAVVALVKSVAQEVAGTEITANAILPAVIDTPATREAMPFADYLHWPSPDSISSVVDFLASPESGVINGAAIATFGNV